jgi:hypothetical protein
MTGPQQDQDQDQAPEAPSTAQLAYEACAAVALEGEAVTPWAALEAHIQNGWHAAVSAVQRAHYAAPGE